MDISFQIFTVTQKIALSVLIHVFLGIYARVSLYSEIELLGIKYMHLQFCKTLPPVVYEYSYSFISL